MFENDLESMCAEEQEQEQEEAIDYMNEFLEAVALGNGDFSIGADGEIQIDD